MLQKCGKNEKKPLAAKMNGRGVVFVRSLLFLLYVLYERENEIPGFDIDVHKSFLFYAAAN